MSAVRRRKHWLLAGLFLCFALTWPLPGRAADTPAPVYVILWFDTEDYLLPQSDDAALKIAEFLTHENIRGTFKVVGEKARTLERRGRADVIAALKKHEIGYHANYHSVQPSPAMYLSTLGWDEGVAEFDRRERPGYDDVQRIFGVAPSCYGQPGSSWGPQVYGAMKRWGMRVYLDAGTHVSLQGKPCYYGGALNLYQLAYLLRTKLGGPSDLEEAEAKFLAVRKALQAEGGGVISVMYHPCEFVHKAFWDGVNFRNGANPPREQWKLPPAKTAEESRVAYQTFEGYIRFMKRFPEVHFITASEAAQLYRDEVRGRRFSAADLQALARSIRPGIGYYKGDGFVLAASEVFVLLNDYVAAAGKTEAVVLADTPFGPTNPVTPLEQDVTTDWSQFSRTALDVADFVRKQGRIPTTVWLGSQAVPPESYLVALARVTKALAEGKEPPEQIVLGPAHLLPAAHVAADNPSLWGWVIFPRGFKAPAMMELAKRQAWTLKPALLHPANAAR